MRYVVLRILNYTTLLLDDLCEWCVYLFIFYSLTLGHMI